MTWGDAIQTPLVITFTTWDETDLTVVVSIAWALAMKQTLVVVVSMICGLCCMVTNELNRVYDQVKRELI